ncbi:unnamed protein product [Caenorhabditis angaria]|uniref:ANK_REP_REGION domain-containing protein n=1 Tax=Caenorhabditis angaria TaxID=860376 RepID=A0A9P1N7L5_9PELO|nr:unnamed protein product [Caenorhabditis angaria]
MSLIDAIDQQNEAEVLKILEEHPGEVSIRDDEGNTYLNYAAEKSSLEIFKKLYELDTTVLDDPNKKGVTPLINSIMSGNLNISKFLAENGANVHQLDNDGHNLIHWATVCGQIESLKWAIDKKVDINLKDYTQEGCAVHYATVMDDISPEVSQAILLILLRHGAMPNSKDVDNRTPILWCASNGNVDAIEVLASSGGDLLIKDRDSLGVLHCAASHGYHEIIDVVMNRIPRTMVDDQDSAGHTALVYAVTYGHYESALKLLQYGADPNHQDQRLRTAAHSAAAKGQMRMLKLLRQYNASFDIQNYRGDMPFHEAVQSGSKDVVEWLLAMDSSVLDAPNHNGRTGLHLAAAAGNLELVILLCSKKCFVDPLISIEKNVYTPLDLAKEQNHELVVDYLTKMFSAKSSAEFSPEYIQKWKVSFEEMVAKAKLERDQRIKEAKNKPRRPSTSNGIIEKVEKKKEDVGVNTSNRTSRSAGVSKSTSVTNLEPEETMQKVQIETIQSAPSPQESDEESDGEKDPNLDIEEEFENLPPLSDDSPLLSAATSIDESDPEYLDEKMREKLDIPVAKTSISKSKKKKKEVRIVPDSTDHLTENKKEVMRVRREPEIGNDGGDVDIYEETEDDPNLSSKSPALATSKYIHERAIFQELTHLKRMQIQYGKVQERILVRSLVSNFCKMHNLDVKNFKFQTFYAWEKFLYDALSEQLKIIYLEERERLAETNMDSKYGANVKLSKFDSRVRQSLPNNDKIRDMQRIYSNSTISTKSSTYRKKLHKNQQQQNQPDSSKRCDCFQRHILL